MKCLISKASNIEFLTPERLDISETVGVQIFYTNISGRYQFGSVATYRCNPGYILWGNDTRFLHVYLKHKIFIQTPEGKLYEIGALFLGIIMRLLPLIAHYTEFKQ